MKKLGIYILFAFLAFATVAEAKTKFGAGIMIGDPTGLSFKYGLKSKRAIDFGFAWSGSVDFHIHGDYLWHKDGAIKIDGVDIDAYYGIGARVRKKDTDRYRGSDDDDTRLGARAPGGIRYVVSSAPLEFFGELALIFDVIPETDAGIDGGIGVRYFF